LDPLIDFSPLVIYHFTFTFLFCIIKCVNTMIVTSGQRKVVPLEKCVAATPASLDDPPPAVPEEEFNAEQDESTGDEDVLNARLLLLAGDLLV
jgi:hypothetical protein